jgi:hypothetical protein
VSQSVLFFSLGNFTAFIATRWAGAVNFCVANLYFYLCRQKFRRERKSFRVQGKGNLPVLFPLFLRHHTWFLITIDYTRLSSDGVLSILGKKSASLFSTEYS